MADRIQDVMSRNVITCDRNDAIADAARKMRDNEIGDVLVTDGGKPVGLLTDRDIVVRAIAERKSLDTSCGDICSGKLFSVSPNDDLDAAIRLMRDNAVRRLPVMDGGKCVGMVSLGDLARKRDPNSVLGKVSAAPSNSMNRPATAK